MSARLDRFKLLVVGDCGVGKSSFVHGVVNQTPLHYPSSTIGCNVEVMAYNYEPDGRAREVFLEFWDVGGSSGTHNSRSIFYENIDGLIVVHDLSNRKSFLNLQQWVCEALNSSYQEFTGITVASKDDATPERRSSGSIPVLVLGTKEDQCSSSVVDQTSKRNARHIGLTEESDVTFCSMNCLQEGQLLNNSNKWQQLHTFFSNVIQNRSNPYNNRGKMSQENNSDSFSRTRKKIY